MLFWSTRTDISKSSANTLAMFVTAVNSPSMDSVTAFARLAQQDFGVTCAQITRYLQSSKNYQVLSE